MNINAIALDLDGTVLDANSKISNELVELLSTLRSKGMKIFIATGRTKIEVADALPKEVQVDGLVTANGMVCHINGRKIASHSLNPELVSKVVAKARENKIYYEVHPHEERRFALKIDKDYIINEVSGEKPMTLHDNEYNSRIAAVHHDLRWLEELDAEDIVKVYFFSMDVNKIKDWKNNLEKMKEEEEGSFAITSSSHHSTEITISHVSKAYGIKLLLQEFQISPRHLLAIGDGENDIPMFNLAGNSVAMKNANNQVKKVADEVTDASYDENGLYLYLKEKFKEIL